MQLSLGGLSSVSLDHSDGKSLEKIDGLSSCGWVFIRDFSSVLASCRDVSSPGACPMELAGWHVTDDAFVHTRDLVLEPDQVLWLIYVLDLQALWNQSLSTEMTLKLLFSLIYFFFSLWLSFFWYRWLQTTAIIMWGWRSSVCHWSQRAVCRHWEQLSTARSSQAIFLEQVCCEAYLQPFILKQTAHRCRDIYNTSSICFTNIDKQWLVWQ